MSGAPFDGHELLLLDLGGVLVELGGVALMQEWSGHGIDEDELWRRWLSSASVRRFETGQGDEREFAEGVVGEFDLQVSPERFLSEFEGWARRAYRGTRETLVDLSTRTPLASLSNTNAIHWSRMHEQMDFLDCFQHHFPSHLTGRIKPDEEAFTAVVEELCLPAERVLFLDDNERNVAAARAAGMQAQRVVGLGQLRKVLSLSDLV
jgi:HAD superfamily hydrolase (TIGR01509 family)